MNHLGTLENNSAGGGSKVMARLSRGSGCRATLTRSYSRRFPKSVFTKIAKIKYVGLFCKNNCKILC